MTRGEEIEKAWNTYLKNKKKAHYLVRESMTKEEKVIIDKMREYYNIGRTYVGILNL